MSWGSRTTGVPFCGEMLDIDWVNPITGASGPFSMGWSGPGNDLTAYAAIVVAMNYQLVTAEVGDDVAIAWVITTGSSAGTFNFADGMDESWNADPAACTNSLGSHTVSVAGDIVIPTTAVTLAAIGGNLSQAQCFIEVTSGTVHISQIKLRVWPPGGPVGGFSTIYPGYDSLPMHPLYFSLSSLNYSGQDDSAVMSSTDAASYSPEPEYYGALGNMRSALPPGEVTGWVQTNPATWGVDALQQAGTSLDGGSSPDHVDFVYHGGAFAGGQSMGYFASFIADGQVAVDPGSDFAPNPYYVPSDPASTKIETGSYTITWQNTALYCQIVDVGSDPMPTGFRLSVNVLGTAPTVELDTSGLYKVTGVGGDMPPTVGSTIVPGGPNDNLFTDASLPIGNAMGATISLFPLLPWETPAYPGKVHGYSCSMSASFNSDMTFTVSYPGYTVWSPSATPTDPPVDNIPWGDFPPGYLVGPNPNLDGAGRGVDVNFA